MARIAEALNISEKTISKDLDHFSYRGNKFKGTKRSASPVGRRAPRSARRSLTKDLADFSATAEN
jgi:DeoR/GlpR family transcriptional regulator of sugar metabolism